MLVALDVAIGLVLLYLLVSLFATALGETFSQAAGLRGRNLARAIQQMLGGSQKLTEQFYARPSVRSLTTGKRKPSYLPPDTFVETLLEMVVGAGGADVPAAKRSDKIAAFGWRSTDKGEPSPSTQPKTKALMTAALNEIGGRSDDTDAETVARRSVATELLRFSDDAGDDPAAFRAKIRQWFDAAMERASGAFKRWMQAVLLGTGLLLAGASDADTIRISNVLFANPTIRTALVDAAATQQVEAAASAGPMLGWTAREAAHRDDPWWWAAKGAGLLLTAIAVSLGGPFWFNALQGLLQLRGSLRPGDRKPIANAEAEARSPTAAIATSAPRPPPIATPIGVGATLQPTTLAYSTGNAYAFAVLSQAAYLDTAGFKAALPEGWDAVLITGTTNDTQAFVARRDHATLVVFRGTESLRDAHSDVSLDLVESGKYAMAAASSAADTPLGRQHAGFTTALEDIWQALEANLDSGSTKHAIHFAGHSLGGALAVLAAARWAASKPDRKVTGIYTYGQPRCGDQGFTVQVDRVIGERLYRHVNHRDAVPRLPPRWAEYRHVGRCLYFDAHGRLRDSPATWFQLLDTVPLDRANLGTQMRETLADHAAQEYVRLTRAQLG